MSRISSSARRMGARSIAGIAECSSARSRAICARPLAAPTDTSMPNSRQNPPSVLMRRVRVPIQRERGRCSACCSTDFTPTGVRSGARGSGRCRSDGNKLIMRIEASSTERESARWFGTFIKDKTHFAPHPGRRTQRVASTAFRALTDASLPFHDCACVVGSSLV